MSRPHRIAAGALTFQDDSVLLVRYRDGSGGTYLVGPGGALDDDENVVQAIIRETREETGITVSPQKVVVIEDLLCSRFKMCKVWMVCQVVDGVIRRTEGADREGIVDAGWFTRAELDGEVVYPLPLLQYDWNRLRSDSWQVECLPSRRAGF
jgi:8-oxo-dGTP diphosphatase